MNAVTDFHQYPSMGDGLRSFIDDPTRSVHFRAADAEHRAGPAGFRLPARWESSVWRQGVRGVQCAAF